MDLGLAATNPSTEQDKVALLHLDGCNQVWGLEAIPVAPATVDCDHLGFQPVSIITDNCGCTADLAQQSFAPSFVAQAE